MTPDEQYRRLAKIHRLLFWAVKFVCRYAYLLDEEQWMCLAHCLLDAEDTKGMPLHHPEDCQGRPWWTNDL